MNSAAGSALIDLRRVGEQNLKRTFGHVFQRGIQIVTTVVKRIVHSSEPERIATVADLYTLVHKHPHAKRLQTKGDFGGIVVAQDAPNAVFGRDGFYNSTHS